MTYYIKGIANNLVSWLPQNNAKQNATEQSQETPSKIQSLQLCLKDQTSQVFQSKMTEIQMTMQTEKDQCIQLLTQMNGTYYQDPKSLLKITWDHLIQKTEEVLKVKITIRDQLNDIPKQVRESINPKGIIVSKLLKAYLETEAKRNQYQERLNQLTATEKASPNHLSNLESKKALLEQRYQEMCGDYYGDPRGQLDIAWKKHQMALAHGSTGENTLKAYLELEEYRKQMEAELFSVNQQLSLPVSGQTYAALTIDSINEEIKALTPPPKEEESLPSETLSHSSNMSWKNILPINLLFKNSQSPY